MIQRKMSFNQNIIQKDDKKEFENNFLKMWIKNKSEIINPSTQTSAFWKCDFHKHKFKTLKLQKIFYGSKTIWKLQIHLCDDQVLLSKIWCRNNWMLKHQNLDVLLSKIGCWNNQFKMMFYVVFTDKIVI